jgi:hypothetical protein
MTVFAVKDRTLDIRVGCLGDWMRLYTRVDVFGRETLAA